MASNADIKQHISSAERAKWNKVISDFTAHYGAAGTDNHALATGAVPGFSTNDFTNELKLKLEKIQDGALNNPHDPTHPASMITGLSRIATSGDWNDVQNKPTAINQVINGNYDSATVSGGIRITIGPSAPLNPQVNKEVWIDTKELVLKIWDGSWKIIGAAYR